MASRYLEDLVAERLAELGLPGTVTIRPRVPLAVRVETGERARHVLDYRGTRAVRFVLDDWDLIRGLRGASIAHVLADKLVASLPLARAA